MAGRGHHTLPRFLQKGFASSGTRGDQVRTWVYRKGKPGFETNIVNVGKVRDFYGKEAELNADEAITDLEGEYASIINEMRTLSDNS